MTKEEIEKYELEAIELEARRRKIALIITLVHSSLSLIIAIFAFISKVS